MANARGRRTERRLIERNTKQLESSPFRSGPHQVPWYEQNWFVGSLSIFITLVASVVATKYGIRWLLLVALPFGLVAAWRIAAAISPSKILKGTFLLLLTASIVFLFLKIVPPFQNDRAYLEPVPQNILFDSTIVGMGADVTATNIIRVLISCLATLSTLRTLDIPRL